MAHSFKMSDLSTPQVFQLDSGAGTLTVTDAGDEKAGFSVTLARGKFAKSYTLKLNRVGSLLHKNPIVNQFTDELAIKPTGTNNVTLTLEICELTFFGGEKDGSQTTVSLE